ncbi:MAG: hypothetical protein LBQ15_03745 [Clostridium sp.]|jgi:hypothetical protein|nr:hypothetical protein [Clostridium sp.]
MRKKVNMLPIIAAVLFLAGCGSRTKHQDVEAKLPGFATLDEMEAYSSTIIRGTRKEQETPVLTLDHGILVSGYTFSQVEVTEIYKDTAAELEAGDFITVLENEVYDPEADVRYHIAGYDMMEAGKEYLLFLTRNTQPNGNIYYVAAGVNYGTVSLEEDSRLARRHSGTDSPPTDVSDYQPVWEAAQEKYFSEKYFSEK